MTRIADAYPGHLLLVCERRACHIRWTFSKVHVQMLILTRRVGETIKIGADIAVTVLGVNGNQVRVGIAAPANVAVHREEVYERIRAQKNPDEPGES